MELIALVASMLAVFFCQFTDINAFECRDGIENNIAYVYSEGRRCGINQTACFQSLKCEKIGETDYKDYEWRCMDRKNCKNQSATLSYAYYDGIRGICCFQSNCNAYKTSKCTANGFLNRPSSMVVYLGLAFAVLVFAIKY